MRDLNTDSTGAELLPLYERMLLIRRAEERLQVDAAAGNLPGGVHLYIGQEAVAVGVCAQLDTPDMITSTHRGHGHFLAKGGDINAMFAEVWGKRTGICKGMGGSMHVADFSKGIIGANGIVGAGFAIATGAAYSAKLSKDGRVAVAFFGDGAANQGVFMESLNISSLWELPVIFVCEHNGFSEFSPAATVTSGEIADRARAFNIPCEVIDGNDVLKVTSTMQAAVAHSRAGKGPSFIEAKTYRIQGHFEAELLFLAGAKYREQEEIDAWRKRDPIERFKRFLLAQGKVTTDQLAAIDARVAGMIEAAAKFAEESEPADTELALHLMFDGQSA